MKHPPKPPTYEALLAAIGAANSAAVLAPLLQTATTYFTGNQRQELEQAIEQRRRELPDGEELRPIA